MLSTFFLFFVEPQLGGQLLFFVCDLLFLYVIHRLLKWLCYDFLVEHKERSGIVNNSLSRTLYVMGLLSAIFGLISGRMM